jgi:IS5 family transposase
VLHGEQVPAADKLVSLFEPHSAVIRRGNLSVNAEFGRKLLLDEVDGGLVTRYAVLEGNPPDAPQLANSLAHHLARFAHPPDVLAADRAFHTTVNERCATEAGVRCVALPKPGGPSARRRAWERRPSFRGAHRFRAGSRVGSACSSVTLACVAAATTVQWAWSAGSAGASWPTTSAR